MDDEMMARLDRLESLVGTAYNRDGAVRIGLENAAAQTDLDAMRTEIHNVIDFLRTNAPNPDMA